MEKIEKVISEKVKTKVKVAFEYESKFEAVKIVKEMFNTDLATAKRLLDNNSGPAPFGSLVVTLYDGEDYCRAIHIFNSIPDTCDAKFIKLYLEVTKQIEVIEIESVNTLLTLE